MFERLSITAYFPLLGATQPSGRTVRRVTLSMPIANRGRAMGPGRLRALIDGLFAIALTLLVLDLPKPFGSKHLTHDLLR